MIADTAGIHIQNLLPGGISIASPLLDRLTGRYIYIYTHTHTHIIYIVAILILYLHIADVYILFLIVELTSIGIAYIGSVPYSDTKHTSMHTELLDTHISQY